MDNTFLEKEEAIVKMLRTVYDPEIPVNIYELGLIYKVDIDDASKVTIEMTLTSPSCPMADFIIEYVRMKVQSLDFVGDVDINLVFEPEWNKDMMSEEAKLELGYL
jgi:FeS assembly SUF system protein